MAYTENKKSTDLETKTPPIDADLVILGDSADTGRAKGLTWANVKATLKTYFDTLYQAVLVSGTSIKTVNSTSLLGSGDVVIPVIGDDVIKVGTVSLTSANILALNTTPIQLVASPGAGKIVIMEEVIYDFTAGTQYANGNDIKIRYSGTSVDCLTYGGTSAMINAATSSIRQGGQASGAISSAANILTTGDNKAVNLTVDTAFITGTGTLKLYYKYRIITL